MHFSMEPVDDVPTDDNVFSHRALCAARYHRNKFFMLDIMSDSVVTNHMPRIHTQDQLNQLFLHRQVTTVFLIELRPKKLFLKKWVSLL